MIRKSRENDKNVEKTRYISIKLFEFFVKFVVVANAGCLQEQKIENILRLR